MAAVLSHFRRPQEEETQSSQNFKMEMIKLGGVAEDGQNVQRAKYFISAVNNSTITLDESELIPINWEGRLVTQPSVSVNELGKQLLKAAADGNVDKVKQLLTKGAPFTADWLGTSPLHLAAQNNHLEMTEILLRAGISKDARTKVDRTPLHMASYEGHLDIVDTLIKHGSDINCRDLLDMTPLHWAVQNGHYDIVNYLVNNGAAMDQKSKFDVTPLMIAEQTGRRDIIQLLVERMNDSAIATQNLLLHLDSENTQDSNQNQCFDDDMELETMDNQELEEYTVVREPIIIKNEFQYTDQEISHNGEVLEEEIERESEQLVQSVTVDSASLTNSLKILQQHGITMLENEENDDGNILNSVMESGHSVVLTDVGKEVLNSVKQSEQKKNIVHIDKKFVSVTPEQFLAMTNNGNNKTLKQIKMLSARPNLKRVVMKKNKIIPISVATICDDSNSSSIKNKSQNDLELITNQLIEARKTIEEYKIKLKKKEQEAERYKMQLKLFMDPS